MGFKSYKRKPVMAEMRPVTKEDIYEHKIFGNILCNPSKDNPLTVSISDEDLRSGSPKIGDMIARKPSNHLDQWLVSEDYFLDNFVTGR